MLPAELTRSHYADRLAQDHWSFLASYAASLCGDVDYAQDLVQQTFERLLATSHLPQRNQRAWLVTVLRNLFVDEQRRSALQFQRVDVDLSLLPMPCEDEDDVSGRPAWDAVTASEVREAFDTLDEPLAAAFALYTFEKRGYAEIAEALGTSVSTVGTRILRARRHLRGVLSSAVHYASLEQQDGIGKAA